MELSLIFEWALVVAFLLALTYVAIVIKNENAAYHESAVDYEFANYRLYIPSWWRRDSPENLNQNQLQFSRHDTNYDWYARFEYFPEDSSRGPREIAQDFFSLHKWELDPDKTETVSVSENFFQESKTWERVEEFYRVESTATEDCEHRLYVDFVCLKDLMRPGYFVAYSKASVLNGGVEGPYFQELMENLEIID